MMPGLFDGTKPETSKQHYERFNMYIKFQTKSGHLTDPVGEAIDLFEHGHWRPGDVTGPKSPPRPFESGPKDCHPFETEFFQTNSTCIFSYYIINSTLDIS